LEQRVLGSVAAEIGALSRMSPVQCVRLIRLIGSYGTLNGQRKPQKVVGSSSVATSWPISSFAAEVLCNWPDGFHAFLDKLRAEASAHDQGRMNGAFGGFYRALYVALREQAFDWVRDAFEDYVAEHWTGSVGLRNRRLPASILERINWMPSQAAAKQLGVSARRLALLIASGQIKAQNRTTRNGRVYQVVRRSDLAAVRVGSLTEMTLAQAADALGLKRQRLARLLPTVCPAANKAADRGAAWAIPRSWVERWTNTFDGLPLRAVDARSEVTLDHVLRFWVASDDALARLLLDIESGERRPLGRVAALKGLSSLILGRADSMRYAAKPDDAIRGWLTVPEAAERLAVKQEVAYALTRLGLIFTNIQRIGRRDVHLVRQRDLDAFQEQYVFARDLATTLRRSPRAVVCALDSLGIQPAAGPNVNGCRQVVYVRASVEAALRLGVAST
jgi:DNA-binding transcriptional MerR regulator